MPVLEQIYRDVGISILSYTPNLLQREYHGQYFIKTQSMISHP